MIRIIKTKEGITLISLVITVIVLIILSGIMITMLNGENGLISKAKMAKENSLNSQEKENTVLSNFENKINQYATSSRGTVNIDQEEYDNLKLTVSNLKSQIENYTSNTLNNFSNSSVSGDSFVYYETKNGWCRLTGGIMLQSVISSPVQILSGLPKPKEIVTQYVSTYGSGTAKDSMFISIDTNGNLTSRSVVTGLFYRFTISYIIDE